MAKTDTYATQLSESIADRSDFRAALEKAESAVAHTFLANVHTGALSNAEITLLLRSADIMSQSDLPEHRELALWIATSVIEIASDGQRERAVRVAQAVSIELGNFPTLELLSSVEDDTWQTTLPAQRQAPRLAKTVLNRTADGKGIFTDVQLSAWRSLKDSSYFSLSGPTSLGKSFILKDHIYGHFSRDNDLEESAIVLVPTKALASQMVLDLRNKMRGSRNVFVGESPKLPRILLRKYPKTILVLTPERLLKHLGSSPRKIRMLVVDEAHRIVSKDDRSPLYIHAISEVLKKHSAETIFASPAIDNPEIFLQLFDWDTNGAEEIRERSVVQRRYFVDLDECESYYFPYLSSSPNPIPTEHLGSDPITALLQMANNEKSIIFVNKPDRAMEVAIEIARHLENIEVTSSLRDLGDFSSEMVHPQYFLSQTAPKGVVFHHGKMPSEVRIRVEEEFSNPNSGVQFIVCTSTLLEGVNLPARNIFILDGGQGGKEFEPIDFENLAGRAGRLTWDFAGNVVAIKYSEVLKKQAQIHRSSLERRPIGSLETFLIQERTSTKKKEFLDMQRVFDQVPIGQWPRRSDDWYSSMNHFAVMLAADAMETKKTALIEMFENKIKNGNQRLNELIKQLRIPGHLLRKSPSINLFSQEAAWTALHREKELPRTASAFSDPTEENVRRFLDRLSVLFEWEVHEMGRKKRLLGIGNNSIGLEARKIKLTKLLSAWMRGLPLRLIIQESIDYYTRKPEKFSLYIDGTWHPTLFDRNSLQHVNNLISRDLHTLETDVKFKIMAYVQSYLDILDELYGGEIDTRTPLLVMEYGTQNLKQIGIQELGIGREQAANLLLKLPDAFQFDVQSGELMEVNLDLVVESKDVDPAARDALLDALGAFTESA